MRLRYTVDTVLQRLLSSVAGVALVVGLSAVTPVRSHAQHEKRTLRALDARRTNRYIFAGIEWGTKLTTARAALVRQGFVSSGRDVDGDYKFSGQVLGDSAFVTLAADRHERVLKVIVMINPDPGGPRFIFEQMKRVLTEKYGLPVVDVERFDSPFHAADGFEEQAIALGKAHYFVAWAADLGQESERLQLTIEKELLVAVVYECPEWDIERKRRLAAAYKAF
jgi:hypothetical protein